MGTFPGTFFISPHPPSTYPITPGDIEVFKVLIEDTDINEDAQTNAGVSPMMMAVQSGNIHLLAECLNSNMNPFLEDGLGQTALDYAKQFPDTSFGTDMAELINDAMV